MVTAYEGKLPYIFISYSHRNSDRVMLIIEALQRDGFRVWFDGGIEAGSEWPEYIASHLRSCACVMTFISNDFVHSKNCRRELNFAQELEKPLLNVYIEDVELSDGMRMQLGLNQALWQKNYSDFAKFLQAVCGARLIQNCKEAPAPKAETAVKTVTADKAETAAKTETAVKTVTADKAETAIKTETAPAPKGRVKLLKWITNLLELSYIYIGARSIGWITESPHRIWLMILLSVIPHVVICLVTKILYATIGKPLDYKTRYDVSIENAIFMLIGAIGAVIYGGFCISIFQSYLANALVSLGLNILPTIVAFFMILFYTSDREK